MIFQSLDGSDQSIEQTGQTNKDSTTKRPPRKGRPMTAQDGSPG
jgi:hypothetical protein